MIFAEFRKSASAELNKDVGSLLKAYQEEVDRLTTRCSILNLHAHACGCLHVDTDIACMTTCWVPVTGNPMLID